MTMDSLSSSDYALSIQSLSFSSLSSSSMTVSTTDSATGAVYSFDSDGSWESNIKYDTEVQSITDLAALKAFTLTLDLT